MAHPTPADHGQVVMRLEGIGKDYGDSTVLDGVSLDLRAGEVLATETLAATDGQMPAWLPAAWRDLPVEAVSHEDFKQRNARARAVIRTGECTPYANVMLVAGVAF